ncbi:MAG: energy-coupling factor transporter transmembrane protein EcfT [Deltaproteobacteria bacterium]|nr:energy-coupling factor transporter transmembrane protein EcfT [Candidatus Zymogenaceae bacterium]
MSEIARTRSGNGLDPRTNLAVLVGSFAVLVMLWDIWWLAVAAVCVLLFGLVSGVTSVILRFWLIPLVVAMFSMVIWSIFLVGDTVLLGIFSMEGMLYGVANAIKLDTMIFAGLFYVALVTPDELTVSLRRLGVPYRLGFSLSYAMRLFPFIMEEARQIARIQKSRGLDLGAGTFRERAGKYIPLLTPIFLTTIRNTNNVSMALESRGFSAKKKGDAYLELKMAPRDWLVLLAVVILTACAVYLHVTGGSSFDGIVVPRWGG